MRCWLIKTCCLILAFGWAVQAQEARYVQIYNLIQEADRINASGNTALAREKYIEAQQELKSLQAGYPNWKTAAVQFRLLYVEEKSGASERARLSPSPARSVPHPPPGPEPPSDQPAIENQIATLTETVHRLEAEKQVLEAKLREALSAQPAAIDPRELARAEERIRSLEKERDVLKVSLEQESAGETPELNGELLENLRNELKEAKERLAGQSEILAALRQENEILKASTTSAPAHLKGAPLCARRTNL